MADETNAGAAPEAGAATTQEQTLLDKIIQEGKMARDESQQAYAKDLISEFVNQILEGGMTVSSDTVASIEAQVARIDELLTAQLNEILHDDDFQHLEASWRGLHYLVFNSETGTR